VGIFSGEGFALPSQLFGGGGGVRQGFSLVEVMVALVLFGALLLVTSWTTKLAFGGKQAGQLRAEAVGVAQGELEAIHAMDFNDVVAQSPTPIPGGFTVERIVRGVAMDEDGNLVDEPLPRAKLKYVEVVVKWSGGEVTLPTLISQRIKEGEG
jgi:prepilin-type N-terminal cleavage/methylation domain-containing protein